MSTKAIEAVLRSIPQPGVTVEDALAELDALQRASATLTRLGLGDYVHKVRDSAKVVAETPSGQSTWEHPDVVAWSAAAELMRKIAEEK